MVHAMENRERSVFSGVLSRVHHLIRAFRRYNVVEIAVEGADLGLYQPRAPRRSAAANRRDLAEHIRIAHRHFPRAVTAHADTGKRYALAVDLIFVDHRIDKIFEEEHNIVPYVFGRTLGTERNGVHRLDSLANVARQALTVEQFMVSSALACAVKKYDERRAGLIFVFLGYIRQIVNLSEIGMLIDFFFHHI